MSTPPIRSVDRLFDIVEQVQKMNGAGVTVLATELGMPKSTVHSHLKTMERRGYVTKEADGTYHLSLQFLVLGGAVRSNRTIHRLVTPLMRDIAEETGESVSFIAEHRGGLVFVGSESGEHAIETNVHVGFRIDLYTIREGMLLLAFLPEERRRSILNDIDFPLENNVGRARFEVELDRIAEEGIVVSNETIHRNVTAVSVPIIDNEDRLHGAIVVAGPSMRFDEDRIEEMTDLLRYKVSEFNVNITYRTPQKIVENAISTKASIEPREG